MNKKIFSVFLILIGLLILTYNACGIPAKFSVLHGTEITNPMTSVSNEIMFGICGVINRCNPQVTIEDCQTGILPTTGFNTPLGLSSGFSVFSSVVQGEQSGILVGNQVGGATCYDSVNALGCSDARVLGAYVPSQPNPFSGAPNMLPVSSCNQAFSPQVIPELVQSTTSFTNSTNLTTTLPISSTGSGNLLVIGIAGGSVPQINSISDNAPGGSNIWINTNDQCTDVISSRAAWIWYAKNSSPGATAVTINWTGSDSGTLNFWMSEFSGIDTANPLDIGALINSQSSSAIASAPQVTTALPFEVVFSILATNVVSGLNGGSLFTSLPIVRGDNLAYEITSAVGNYGAQWTQPSSDYCSSSVAFKAAQQ